MKFYLFSHLRLDGASPVHSPHETRKEKVFSKELKHFLLRQKLLLTFPETKLNKIEHRIINIKIT